MNNADIFRAALGRLSRGVNEFRIFTLGEAFDIDAYLATTKLQFDGLWRKGEAGNDHSKSNGIAKVLGDGQQITWIDQEAIAIEYLSTNRDALRALAEFPGVTTFKLGLQYNFPLQANSMGICMGPSAELMWHLLDTGIDLNFYVVLDHTQE